MNFPIPISTYKLFPGYSIVPEFLKKLGLSAIYCLFYGEICKLINHPQNRANGYIIATREQMAAIMGCSTRSIDRLIAISKKEQLMTIFNTGRDLLISICYHPLMPISADQAQRSEIKLPFELSMVSDQVRQKRRSKPLSHDHGLKKNPEKEGMHAASPMDENDLPQREIVEEQVQQNDTSIDAFNSPTSLATDINVDSNNQSIEVCKPSIDGQNTTIYNLAPSEVTESKSKLPNKVNPFIKAKPLSKFSLDEIEAFAQSEKARNGTIYNLPGFIRARHRDGLDDAQIDAFFQEFSTKNACTSNSQNAQGFKPTPKQATPNPTYIGKYVPQEELPEADAAKQLAEIKRRQGEMDMEVFIDAELRDTIMEVAKIVVKEIGYKKPSSFRDYFCLVQKKLNSLEIDAPGHAITTTIKDHWVAW